MPGSHISGSIHQTVTVGTHGIDPLLTITSTGTVTTFAGETAILVPADLSGVQMDNAGRVTGGVGGIQTYHAGGIGIDFEGSGTLHNTGRIAGGRGGYDKPNEEAGGVGVLFAGSHLVNGGTIAGGAGGTVQYYSRDGGTGIVLDGAGTITNTGRIAGGRGGYGELLGGSGGLGISMSDGGTLVNHGPVATAWAASWRWVSAMIQAMAAPASTLPAPSRSSIPAASWADRAAPKAVRAASAWICRPIPW